MIGVSLRLCVMLLILGISGAAAWYGGGAAAWFVFGCCAAIAVIGGLASLLITGDIRLERKEGCGRLQNGDSLQAAGMVKLPFRFPFALVIVVDMWQHEQTGRLLKGTSLLVPFGRMAVPFDYNITGLMRGSYRLVMTEAIAGDWLHLCSYRKQLAGEDGELLVYPKPLPETGLRTASVLVGESNVGTVRAYMEGDPLKRIDWKSYLRRRRLMTKLPEPDDWAKYGMVLASGDDAEQFERIVGAAYAYVCRYPDSAIGLIGGSTSLQQSSMVASAHLTEWLAKVQRVPNRPLRQLLNEAISRWGTECELVVAVARLDEAIGELASIARSGQPCSILYASPNAELSAYECAIASELQLNGCEFGFVPNHDRREGEERRSNG